MAKLAAETGWLNLIGRWWITPSVVSIGSGARCDIRLETGPERIGLLTLNADDTGLFEPDHGDAVVLDRAAGVFNWRAGRFLLEITTLNALRALRIRDAASSVAAESVPRMSLFSKSKISFAATTNGSTWCPTTRKTLLRV